MSKPIWTLLVGMWILPALTGLAQDAKPAANTLDPTLIMKRTVAFLSAECQNAQNRPIKFQGTGFFVFYNDNRLGKDAGFVYLVTNRHIAEPRDDDGRKLRVRKFLVRMNLRQPEGGLESEEGAIPFASRLQWYFHPDESVDLAVLSFLPDQKRYDFDEFPTSLFATKDVITSEAITEGERVLFVGFFYQFPGIKRIQPIVREGVIAMMPEEKMKTPLGLMGYVYLADAHVFGGNSGAPIWVSVNRIRGSTLLITAGIAYRLLGVVSGYYYKDEKFELQAATTLRGNANANSGISVVVPAYQLLELLNLPELQRKRDAEVRRVQSGPK